MPVTKCGFFVLRLEGCHSAIQSQFVAPFGGSVQQVEYFACPSVTVEESMATSEYYPELNPSLVRERLNKSYDYADSTDPALTFHT